MNICFLSGARIAHLINFSNIVPIMLALCLMLLVTYYALNYAGIIGRCLTLVHTGVYYTVILMLYAPLYNTVIQVLYFTVIHRPCYTECSKQCYTQAVLYIAYNSAFNALVHSSLSCIQWTLSYLNRNVHV